jgi:hypothetical protein
MAEADPRVLMKVAYAVRFLAHVNQSMQPKAGDVNAVGKVLEDPTQRVPVVNVEDRKLAEFNEDEIYEILRQAGFRSLVPRDKRPEAGAQV